MDMTPEEKAVIDAAEVVCGDTHLDTLDTLKDAVRQLRASRSPLPDVEELSSRFSELWRDHTMDNGGCVGAIWADCLRWVAEQMQEGGPVFTALPGSPTYHSAFAAAADQFRGWAKELEDR